MNQRLTWIGPLSGVFAAVLYFFSRSLGGAHIPGALDIRPEDAGSVISVAFADNADSFRTGAHLGMISAFFLIIYSADLWRRIAGKEGPAGMWGLVAFGGGLVLSLVIIFQNGISLAARVVGTEGLSSEIAQTLLAIQWSGSDWMAAPLAAMVLAVSVASLTTALLPAWYAWVGLALSAGIIVTLAIPGDTPNFIFVGLSLFWITVLAVMLLWMDLRPTGEEQQPAPAPS